MPSPKDIAREVATAAGKPELAELVTGGSLGASDAISLLAGMYDGVTRMVFSQIVPVIKHDAFESEDRPCVSKIVLANGDIIRITIEEL